MGFDDRATELAALNDAERDFIRQSERTVDNLKRLTAYVFAISFTLVGTGIAQKLQSLLSRPIGQWPAGSIWLINIEMLFAFAATAGLFFYQADKYLDNRLARFPIPEPKPLNIGGQYLVILFTMTPFFIMAYGLMPGVTSKVGFLWFFAAYLVLFSVGLVLLLAQAAIDIRARQRHADSDALRIESRPLRAFWFAMNSFYLAVLVGLFYVANRITGEQCPVAPSAAGVPWFLYFFGLAALTRDVIDYRWAFGYHYPTRDPHRLDLWPITKWQQSKRTWRAYAFGFLSIGAFVFFIVRLGLLDPAAWIAYCAR